MTHKPSITQSQQDSILRIASCAGLLGVGLIALGALIPALVYEGRAGEPYSVLNHFISELGEVGVSQWAVVFNVGLVTGGLCLTIFMLGVAIYIRGWFGYLFGAFGLATGGLAAAVGLTPMHRLLPHIKVATAFFNMGLITMILFSLYVLFSKQRKFPRWFIVPGLLTTLLLLGFLYLPSSQSTEAAGDFLTVPETFLNNRPDIWTLAILEWGIAFGLFAWIVAIAHHLNKQVNG